MALPESEKVRVVSGVLERYRELLGIGEHEPTTALARTMVAACPSVPDGIDLTSIAVESCQVLARASVRTDPKRYVVAVFRGRVNAAIEASRKSSSASKARVDDDDKSTRYDPSHDLAEIGRLEAASVAAERAAMARMRASLPPPEAVARCKQFLSALTRPGSDFADAPPRPFPPPRPAWYPPRAPREHVELEPKRGETLDGALHTLGDVLGERVELMAEVERDEHEGR